MQSIDWVEIYAYVINKEVIHKKEEIEYANIIKYKKKKKKKKIK